MKTALDSFLNETDFDNISEVWEAFRLCENLDDVQRVVGEIPLAYGGFLINLLDEEGNRYNLDDLEDMDEDELAPIAPKITGFLVTNIFYDKDSGNEIEEMDFEWFNG